VTSAALIVPAKARKAELARQLGVSRQAIGDLVKRGVLSEDKDGLIDVELARVALANRVHPGSKTAQAIAAGAPAAVPTPATASANDEEQQITSYHVAKTLNETAQARMNQLKLREMQGDLIRVDAVRSTLASAIASTREALMQIPARLSPVIAPETDQAKVHDLLHTELVQVLDHLNRARERIVPEATP